MLDRSRDVRIQLDLHTRWVYYSDRGTAKRRLYRIVDASGRSPAPAPRGSANGFTVNRVVYGANRRRTGEFRATRRGRWVESHESGARFRYEETNRDEWSVYLHDRQRNVDIQLDLHRRTVYYSSPNERRRALYQILSAHSTTAADTQSCASAVQGRIAWNYENDRRWNPANVASLCAGARNSEPARCFSKIMHGGINWGGGTRWEWKNAIDLCSGTANANATVACFEHEVRAGARWRDAIAHCRR